MIVLNTMFFNNCGIIGANDDIQLVKSKTKRRLFHNPNVESRRRERNRLKSPSTK